METLAHWVGREAIRREGLHAEPVSRMAATLGHDYRLPEAGEALPPLWHWILFPEVVSQADLGPDGHALRGEFLPPVALPRRMWAGGRFTMTGPLCVGDQVTRKSTILDVTEKSGRSGALVFVTVAHEFSVDGEIRLTEEHDIVYREPPSPEQAQAVGETPPTQADWTKVIHPNPVTLFQYSALTFNGHRIHYDVDYCRDVEGYPGLVVHGPLTATLLAELVRSNLPSARIDSFEFRALRPLFDLEAFQVAGRRDGDTAQLWAVDPQGYLAMTARAMLSHR